MKVNMKLKDPAIVQLISFSDDIVSDQKVFFEGTAQQLRDQQFGLEWDGFNLGDRFTVEDNEVKVFKVTEEFGSNLEVSKIKYLIGPPHLDTVKVNKAVN